MHWEGILFVWFFISFSQNITAPDCCFSLLRKFSIEFQLILSPGSIIASEYTSLLVTVFSPRLNNSLHSLVTGCSLETLFEVSGVDNTAPILRPSRPYQWEKSQKHKFLTCLKINFVPYIVLWRNFPPNTSLAVLHSVHSGREAFGLRVQVSDPLLIGVKGVVKLKSNHMLEVCGLHGLICLISSRTNSQFRKCVSTSRMDAINMLMTY